MKVSKIRRKEMNEPRGILLFFSAVGRWENSRLMFIYEDETRSNNEERHIAIKPRQRITLHTVEWNKLEAIFGQFGLVIKSITKENLAAMQILARHEQERNDTCNKIQNHTLKSACLFGKWRSLLYGHEYNTYMYILHFHMLTIRIR